MITYTPNLINHPWQQKGPRYRFPGEINNPGLNPLHKLDKKKTPPCCCINRNKKPKVKKFTPTQVTPKQEASRRPRGIAYQESKGKTDEIAPLTLAHGHLPRSSSPQALRERGVAKHSKKRKPPSPKKQELDSKQTSGSGGTDSPWREK